MGIFRLVAKTVAIPIKVCSLPVRLFEATLDMDSEPTIFDNIADKVVEMGEGIDKL